MFERIFSWLVKKEKEKDDDDNIDKVTIGGATFSKDRIRAIEESWIRDGLIR